jgi:PPM family protein phosphatase
MVRLAAGLPGGHIFSRSSMLDVEFAQLSDVGRVRGHNEDYFGHAAPAGPEQARTRGWLFVLADGVGGQDRGEVAARAAVESVLAGFRQAGTAETHSNLLQRLVRDANTHVYETGRSAAPGGTNMATTIVACALRYDRAVVAHVGDSRCYLVRRGQAKALTRDHTLIGEQLRMGLISQEEAAQAETRHLLSRSLGNNLFVSVDVDEHQVVPGDVLLLCSDGLHAPVPAAELAGIVSADWDLNVAARELISRANQKDGADNITVQLIRIRDVERIGMYRGRPYKLR